MKVRVDRARCCGYTVCHEICPQVFELDDAGFAVAANGGTVPATLEADVQEAIDACPAEAILRPDPDP